MAELQQMKMRVLRITLFLAICIFFYTSTSYAWLVSFLEEDTFKWVDDPRIVDAVGNPMYIKQFRNNSFRSYYRIVV